MNDYRLPQHFRYLIPIIEVLKELGGSGRAGEVIDLVVERLKIPDEEINETISSGQSRERTRYNVQDCFLPKPVMLILLLMESGYSLRLD